jgi:hypothetical protein
MAKHDQEQPATITELQAQLTELRNLIQTKASGGSADAEAIGKAVGEAIRRSLHPTQEDRLKQQERRAGEPRTIVDAVSQYTGAKFKAVIRPDGTCETFVPGSYQYPDTWGPTGSAWPKGMEIHQRDSAGNVTPHLTVTAKQMRTLATWIADLKAYVQQPESGIAFPVEARADSQEQMQKLRDAIASAAARLTEEAGPLVAPTG